mgnify:CR=1 FL=1
MLDTRRGLGAFVAPCEIGELHLPLPLHDDVGTSGAFRPRLELRRIRAGRRDGSEAVPSQVDDGGFSDLDLGFALVEGPLMLRQIEVTQDEAALDAGGDAAVPRMTVGGLDAAVPHRKSRGNEREWP